MAICIIFFILCAGIAVTALTVLRGNRYFDLYWEEKDRDYAHRHEMFDGAKELAIDDVRRRYFLHRELLPAITRLGAERKRKTFWNIGEILTRVFCSSHSVLFR